MIFCQNSFFTFCFLFRMSTFVSCFRNHNFSPNVFLDMVDYLFLWLYTFILELGQNNLNSVKRLTFFLEHSALILFAVS